MKMGVQTYSFGALARTRDGLERCLEAFAEMGGEVAELCYDGSIPAAEVADISRKTGIQIVSTHTSLDRMINDLDRLIDEHLEFGAHLMGVGGMPSANYKWPHVAKKVLAFADTYNDIAERAAARDMRLTYHNHGGEGAIPRGLSQNIFDTIMQRTSPNVTMCLDMCWALAGGKTADRYIQEYRDRVTVLHVKDYDKKAVPLGRGRVEVEKCLSLAAGFGTDYAVIEEESGGDSMALIRNAAAFLRPILNK